MQLRNPNIVLKPGVSEGGLLDHHYWVGVVVEGVRAGVWAVEVMQPMKREPRCYVLGSGLRVSVHQPFLAPMSMSPREEHNGSYRRYGEWSATLRLAADMSTLRLPTKRLLTPLDSRIVKPGVCVRRRGVCV